MRERAADAAAGAHLNLLRDGRHTSAWLCAPRARAALLLDQAARIRKLGARRTKHACDVQADIAQVPVRRPAFRETTSLGAALAAGLTIGFYSMEQIFDGSAQTDADSDLYSPAWDLATADAKHASWQLAVSRSLGLADLA